MCPMISFLYVDDEETLLEITKIYMERTGGFAVDTCTSAEDAIEKLTKTHYDAVVSDYQMPEMDGLEFLKYLRKIYPSLPFILFTGKGREEVAIEALNSGADFYLQKGGEPRSQFAELAHKIQQAVKRNQAETALLMSEEHFRRVFDNAPVGIFHSTPDGQLLDVNPVFARMFGYSSPDEMVAEVNKTGMGQIHYLSPERREAIVREVMAEKTWRTFDNPFRKIDGGEFQSILSLRSYANPNSGNTELEGFVVDVTESRSAEARIRASERRFRNLFDAAGDSMLVLDYDTGAILDANPAATCLFSLSREEFRNLNHQDLYADGDGESESGPTQCPGLPQVRHYRKKDGVVFPAEITSSHYPQKDRTISIICIRDITERKKAEERVIAAQRLYAVLSQINQSIVHLRDLEKLLADICHISIEFGKFRMVWVGFLDHETGTIRPVAHDGYEEGYLSEVTILAADDPLGNDPTGRALRFGINDTCNDIAADPRMKPWRKEALMRGFRSCAAFPIRLHDQVVGAITLFSGEPEFFTETEIQLLDEIAMDVSFALDMLDEQARRTRAEKALAGSEERVKFLAQVFELSSQPFAVGYPDFSIGVVNPAFCELLGYTEPELHSLTWTGITPPEFHEHEAEVIRELNRTGIPQRYEKEFIRKDGSRVPIEMFTHRVLDLGGNPAYHYAFITDITERRRAEDIIRAERDLAQRYLDIAGVMLAVMDQNGIMTLINRKGCEILGYREEEILGTVWVDNFVPEPAREEVRDVLSQILTGKAALFEYHENTVLTKKGEERILAFHNTLLRGQSGDITGILFSGQDITAQRAAETALRGSEERFRNLIQNSSDMIRIIGTDRRIMYSSPSTLRITGYDPKDVTARDFLDFVHPDDRQRVGEAFGEVVGRINRGTPTEYRIRHAGGHDIFVESVAINQTETPGINGIVTTTRDITGRKTAEQRLRESEVRYRTVFESSTDAILLMGDGCLDCNPEAERLLLASRSEILGHRLEDFSPPSQPDGRDSHEALSGQINAAEAGQSQLFSWVCRRADDSMVETEVSLRSIRFSGEQRMLVTIHDVSGLNRAAMQIRRLASFPGLNPDPVIEVSPGKEITFANPATYTILRNLNMPENPAAFLPDDFDDIAVQLKGVPPENLYREVSVGDHLFGETIAYATDFGTIRIYAHDITERVRITSAFEQANRKLNLLSSITRHDIKNKLTGVLGYMELSLGATQDPALIEYLKRAETSANAILQQISFTKEYENLGVRSPSWLEISSVIDEVKPQVDLGNIDVVDETGGLEIYADPMFPKVIFNLMDNSLQHGKRTRRISLSVLPGPEQCLLVYEDDGVGIPAGDKEKIFGRVARASPGIGLFLSREILGITGITIIENGTPGNGARFEISVPRGKFHMKSGN